MRLTINSTVWLQNRYFVPAFNAADNVRAIKLSTDRFTSWPPALTGFFFRHTDRCETETNDERRERGRRVAEDARLLQDHSHPAGLFSR